MKCWTRLLSVVADATRWKNKKKTERKWTARKRERIFLWSFGRTRQTVSGLIIFNKKKIIIIKTTQKLEPSEIRAQWSSQNRRSLGFFSLGKIAKNCESFKRNQLDIQESCVWNVILMRLVFLFFRFSVKCIKNAVSNTAWMFVLHVSYWIWF